MTLAVVLAGGRGRRLRPWGGEKPLVRVGRVPLVVRVLSAVRSVPGLDVRVAVSPFTPRTARACRDLGVEVLTTPGAGYAADVGYLLERFPRFGTISADLPFLEPDPLARFLAAAASSATGLLGVLPAERCRFPIPEEVAWRPRPRGPVSGRLVGINSVVAHSRRPDRVYRFEDPELEYNVNRPIDLARARRHAGRGARPTPHPRSPAGPPRRAGR